MMSFGRKLPLTLGGNFSGPAELKSKTRMCDRFVETLVTLKPPPPQGRSLNWES